MPEHVLNVLQQHIKTTVNEVNSNFDLKEYTVLELTYKLDKDTGNFRGINPFSYATKNKEEIGDEKDGYCEVYANSNYHRYTSLFGLLVSDV